MLNKREKRTPGQNIMLKGIENLQIKVMSWIIIWETY